MRKPPRWVTATAVFFGTGAVIAALAIPALMSSKRASRERQASTGLKTLTSAEADFRANDRDWNHVNDFWTGDVSGLYYVKCEADHQTEVRLIEEAIADADPLPLFLQKHGPRAREGYLYRALERDDSIPGKEGEYKADTDKSGRKVHNESKFGFCAYPESDRSGGFQFKVNENNTIFRESPTKPRDSFPNDEQLKSYWSKID